MVMFTLILKLRNQVIELKVLVQAVAVNEIWEMLSRIYYDDDNDPPDYHDWQSYRYLQKPYI